jgi:hypothetical protein
MFGSFPGHLCQSEYPVLVAYGEIAFVIIKHIIKLFYGEIGF